MKYLFDINEFSNYMLDYYSFKISRETAEETKLKDLKNNNYDFPEEKFNKFLSSWKIMVNDIRSFKEEATEIIELSEDQKLNFIFFYLMERIFYCKYFKQLGYQELN